jgi:hypothetical protein
MRTPTTDTRHVTENHRPCTRNHGPHDGDVPIRSLRWIVAAAVATGLMISRESPVEACGNLPGPGILARSVWPGPDQHPPTNARFVVSYELRATFPGFEVPALGPDVALLDGDGTPVAASIEVVGSRVVLQPSAALLPNHAYQIADRRTVPCDHNQNGCALTNEPRAFASFTTGTVADTTPPIFSGVTSIAIGQRETCDNGGCCGPYDNVPVALSWSAGSDDLAGGDLRYNAYHRPDSEPATVSLIAGLVEGTELLGLQMCGVGAPRSITGPIETAPGTYMVRAVDWAGNEESSSTGQVLADLCSRLTGPTGPTTGQQPGQQPAHAAAGCSVAGSAGEVGSGIWWLMALGAAAARRFRARARSAGRRSPPPIASSCRPCSRR